MILTYKLITHDFQPYMVCRWLKSRDPNIT